MWLWGGYYLSSRKHFLCFIFVSHELSNMHASVDGMSFDGVRLRDCLVQQRHVSQDFFFDFGEVGAGAAG